MSLAEGAKQRAPSGGISARSSRDFYSELIKGSQLKSSGFLAERERWLRSLHVDGREELLFELEMLLRGMERYFNLHDLPIDASGPVVTRDFRSELKDVRNALDHSIRIARRLLDPESDQKMVFRRYVESQITDHRARRMLIEDELDEDSPQESLFVLRRSFEALRSIIDHLLKLRSCPFRVFSDVGDLVLREVVLNRYFRPFRPLEFRIEYDRIKSVPILEALAGLPEPDRRLFTVAFLGLFRLLHYLSYVDTDAKAVPRRCRVILALVRSEAISLVGHLESELAEKASGKRYEGAAIKAAREVARETRRIAKRLAEAPERDAQAPLQAARDLTALFRKQIGALAVALSPRLAGDDLFRRLVSRVAMGERLRQELWVLAELCRDAEQVLRTGPVEAAARRLDALRRCVAAFQDVGYQLLRYGDFESFDRFTAILMELERPPTGPEARGRLADDCRMFAQVAETTFAAVGRRAEIARTSFDERAAREALQRFRS